MTVPEFDVQLLGVKKWYGDVAAVKGIDLAITRGEMVSFLGPSGCGKTTTLRMIAGLEEPDEGEIVIRGNVMNDIPTYRRNIGMVFQNYALFPHMTVFDNIAFGLSMRKEKRSDITTKVKDVMSLVRLETMANRLPSQLSGGQRQRVALARALVTKPNVLLLDEPLGALDKKLREQMQVEIRMLQREVGITTIFVTHDQEEALTLSDRIVVMNGGSIVQLGTPQEIYQRPATPFVSDFIGVSNAITAIAGERKEGWLEVSLRGSGTRILASADANALPGEQVEISVRPENIVLCDPQSDGYNVLDGTVSHVIYTGAITYFHLDAGAGSKFIALTPNTGTGSASQQPKVGDQITFGWRYECTRLLTSAA